MTPAEIEDAAIRASRGYSDVRVIRWSTTVAATTASIAPGSDFSQGLGAYNVDLTGASGHTSCQFGGVTSQDVGGSGLPEGDGLTTTTDEKSPGISGVGIVDAGAHYSPVLICESDTPFIVDGRITTSRFGD